MLKRAIQLAALAAGLSACGAASTPGPASSSSSGTSSTPPPAADVLVRTASLGQVLTDKSGMTLYYFTPEKGTQLVCDTGACLATWPFATASGAPVAASGVTGQLTTVAAPSGAMVIVYSGWPLHMYSGDHVPGDTNGQGVAGKWFAATPGLTSSGGGGAATSSAATPSGTYNPY